MGWGYAGEAGQVDEGLGGVLNWGGWKRRVLGRFGGWFVKRSILSFHRGFFLVRHQSFISPSSHTFPDFFFLQAEVYA